MGGPIESEIKLRMASPEAAREAVARLGARPVRARHFEDNVILDDTAKSLSSSGRLLRLRTTNDGAVITFKGPRQIVEGIRSRPEVETAVADADGARMIFAGLGFRPIFRYQKYRESFAWKDAEIVVDETPIGVFLEIEGQLDTIHAAAAGLGRGPADYVTDSYASLFFASGGTGDMIFR